MQDMKIHMNECSTVPIFSYKRRKTMCAVTSSWLSSAFINFLRCSVDPLSSKLNFVRKFLLKRQQK